MELRDANVLLTGGSRGIGPHIARALLGRGSKVTLAARTKEDLQRVRDSLDPDRTAISVGDVTNEEDRAAIVADAEAAFGPTDVLVNNAGIETILAFTRYSAEEIRAIIDVNLNAPIQLTRLVVPGMIERGRGHIVNVSSLAGKAAVPYNTVYSATKHGLVGFTYSIRAELHGTGVSASAVCPGYVLGTGMFASHHVPGESTGPGTVTTPRKVAASVVRVIEKDKPDEVVAGFLPKMADVVLAASPRLTIAISRSTGGFEPMRRKAEANAAEERS